MITTDCPVGMSCQAGICADAGDPTGPDADPAEPDAGPPSAAPCGSMGLLRDDFDDSVTGPLWRSEAQTGARLVETGGHLAISLGAGTAAIEGRYGSKHAYDLRGGALAVTVVRTAGQYTAIEVCDPDDRGGALAVENGALVAYVVDGELAARRSEVAYDPARHRHWRLREGSGTLHWETSADRTTWSSLHSEPLPMTGTLAHAHLVARGQSAAGGETWFDDVNLPAGAEPGFCAASSLQDGFDDGTLARSYNNWHDRGSCAGREVGGVLELAFSGVGESWCGTETRQLVDLRDDAVVVEVPSAPSLPMAMTFFEAVAPGGDKVQIGHGPDGLYSEMLQGGRRVGWRAIPYDPVRHRFWRLRESGGQIFWDTSPDGRSWTNHSTAAAAFDVSAVMIDLAAGHWNPGPGTPFVARYDRLNAAP